MGKKDNSGIIIIVLVVIGLFYYSQQGEDGISIIHPVQMSILNSYGYNTF